MQNGFFSADTRYFSNHCDVCFCYEHIPMCYNDIACSSKVKEWVKGGYIVVVNRKEMSQSLFYIKEYWGMNYIGYIYSTRNGYRAPAFYELGLSMTCKTGKGGRLILSVMNAYNRKNVFTIYTSRDDYDFSDIGMHKMYLYGVLPSISYQFTF